MNTTTPTPNIPTYLKIDRLLIDRLLTLKVEKLLEESKNSNGGKESYASVTGHLLSAITWAIANDDINYIKNLISEELEKIQLARYQLHIEEDRYFAYDRQTDIFVDRFNQPNTDGYLTEAEAEATVNLLNNPE